MFTSIDLGTAKSAKTGRIKKQKERGCDVCPLNKVKGVNRILGRIRGKDILIIAQSPGPEENDHGKELIGPSGQFLWKELAKVGIRREDCDIQNVVRCFPADLVVQSYDTYLKMRTPTAEEIRCCSIHTDRALAKSRAKHILILGQIAAKAALSTRSVPKQKIFWSDDLQAKVYIADHPAYFIRGYGSGDRLAAFRETLALLAANLQISTRVLSDEFAYVKKQDYRLVRNAQEAARAVAIIRRFADKGIRIAVDEEDAEIAGKHRVICCGFSPKPGVSFVFVFVHPDQDEHDGNAVLAVAKEILEDPKILKAFHYGCSDIRKFAQLEKIAVQGEDHDTNLSEYLRFPDRKRYGLDAIAESRFPEFSGYKTIVVDEMLAGVEVPTRTANGSRADKYDYIDSHKLFDVGKLSMETLRLYNGADTDLCKRVEVNNKKHVKPALLKLYMDLNHVLYDMESNGPLFDFEQHAKLDLIYPEREKKLRRKLQRILGDENFNPGSPAQVSKAIYETLKIPFPFPGKPNTQKNTLLVLSREHKFPRLVRLWRQAAKAKSTYLDGYKACAEFNGGRLRTRWWSTGTRTGRLSSGGNAKRKDNSVINFQNIHGDPQIQDMCVADLRWRKVYRVIGKILSTCKDRAEAEKKIEDWICEYMPDLSTFLVLDYGQVEVRVAALLSGDKNLMADCAKSDIHTAVGVVMTGWDAEKIANDKPTRTSTKNVHFGILFGSSEEGTYNFVVARTPEDQEPMSREEVRKARQRYFKRYGGVQRYIDRQCEFAIEHHYVETLFGMRQPLNITGDEQDSGYGDQDDGYGFWRNQAVNGPVQGTAHQLLVCGIVNVRRMKTKYVVLDVPVADVHDALYFRVRVLDLVKSYRKARYLMEHESLNTVKKDFPEIDWKVPIVTEAEAGLRLGCLTEIKEGFTVGGHLIEWYEKCKKQITALDGELASLTPTIQ